MGAKPAGPPLARVRVPWAVVLGCNPAEPARPHCPIADGEVHALLIKPTGVVNTGDAGGALTAAYDDSLA